MKSLSDVQSAYLTTAYQYVVPETVLVGVACLLFLLAVFAPRRVLSAAVAVAGLVGAAVAAALMGPVEVASFWSVVDGTPFDPRGVAPFDPTLAAAFVRWVALAAGAVFVLVSWPEVSDDNAGEYFGCLLVMIAGTSLVGRANDLVALFLALELVSIPTYVLLYLPVRSRAGQEAAAKYFLLSVLSSAVLLFGFSYVYGLTGTTNLGAAVAALAEAHRATVNPMALVAAVMVVAGLGFRITAFPFHFYAPDVYQGGPTGVVAQLSFVPKVVGFVALARVLGLAAAQPVSLPFDASATLVPLLLWIIALATMTFGNVLALLQDDLRRLLAYSGIAHGGYMLLAVIVACALPDSMRADVSHVPIVVGLDALWVYLVAYGLMTVGAFAVLAYLGRSAATVDDLNGLGESRPLAAAVLTVLLVSLIGLPPTAGFVGKLLIFIGAFDAPTVAPMFNLYRILAVLMAVNAAIGAVYYLRLIGVMYLRSPLRPPEPPAGRAPLAAAALCALATLALGIYPGPLTDAAKRAAPVQDDRPRAAAGDT